MSDHTTSKDKSNTSNKADRNKESNSASGASNSVGPTRRYVSGDEEKSSSSHQFHKS